MEKNDKRIDVSCQHLVQAIVEAVRAKAETIPEFATSRNGCIRIGLLPCCDEADVWMGGQLSTFPDDVCLREFNYPILPGGSRIITWEDPDDHHAELVNCYAYSALKVAGLMWRRKHNLSNPAPTEQAQYLTEENGWSQHMGALDAVLRMQDEDYAWLFICVSGAASTDDRRCAFSGLMAARELLQGKVGSFVTWNISVP